MFQALIRDLVLDAEGITGELVSPQFSTESEAKAWVSTNVVGIDPKSFAVLYTYTNPNFHPGSRIPETWINFTRSKRNPLMPLSIQAQVNKDSKTRGTLQHRHFATIAAIISEMPSSIRDDVTYAFASGLKSTNPNFNYARFIRACQKP